MGKSGISCARLLKRQGFQVLISDSRVIPVPTGLEGIETETGDHSDAVYKCDFIIKSPGIMPNNPVLKKLKKLKKPIFSELETACAFIPNNCKIFAITGTNGKTTTTVILSDIMKAHCINAKKNRRVSTVHTT